MMEPFDSTQGDPEASVHRPQRGRPALHHGASGTAFGWLVAGSIVGIALLIWLAVTLVEPVL